MCGHELSIPTQRGNIIVIVQSRLIVTTRGIQNLIRLKKLDCYKYHIIASYIESLEWQSKFMLDHENVGMRTRYTNISNYMVIYAPARPTLSSLIVGIQVQHG